MKVSLLFIVAFLFISLTIKAQGPPSVAMPEDENRILIDELMELTSFETYFINICKLKIDEIAKNQNWNNTTVEKKKEKIKFGTFKSFTIYNVYSQLNKNELQNLVNAYRTMKRRKIELKFFIFNETISKNIDTYVDNISRE